MHLFHLPTCRCGVGCVPLCRRACQRLRIATLQTACLNARGSGRTCSAAEASMAIATFMRRR